MKILIQHSAFLKVDYNPIYSNSRVDHNVRFDIGFSHAPDTKTHENKEN